MEVPADRCVKVTTWIRRLTNPSLIKDVVMEVSLALQILLVGMPTMTTTMHLIQKALTVMEASLALHVLLEALVIEVSLALHIFQEVQTLAMSMNTKPNIT